MRRSDASQHQHSPSPVFFAPLPPSKRHTRRYVVRTLNDRSSLYQSSSSAVASARSGGAGVAEGGTVSPVFVVG